MSEERCPKCDAERVDPVTCHQCGIIFARYRPESAQLAAVNRILARQQRPPRSRAPLLVVLLFGVAAGAFAVSQNSGDPTAVDAGELEDGALVLEEGADTVAVTANAREVEAQNAAAASAASDTEERERDWDIELRLREDIAISDLAKREGIEEPEADVVLPAPTAEPSESAAAERRAARCGSPRETSARVRAIDPSEIRRQLVLARPCPVVVMVYASWCPACRGAFPNVVSLGSAALGGVRVVPLSVDRDDESLASYLGDNRLPFEALRLESNGDETGRALGRLGMSYPGSIPYFALLEGDEVVMQGTGGSTLASITEHLRRR